MKKYLGITAFSIVYAAGVSLFLDPNGLVPGGVTGIAILLSYITPVETGTWLLILNIPILLLGLWKFGIKFIISTAYSIIVISICTNIFATVSALTTDNLAACLGGAFLVGTSVAAIIKSGATTGGLDIIVMILRRKHPHIKTSTIFLMIDSGIVFAAILIYGQVEAGIYAGITVLVAAYIMEMVLYGKDEAKFFYIISDRAKDISNRLIQELSVGVTLIDVTGAYENKEKKMILCITKKYQAPKLEEVVKEVDKNAFLIITSANEIYGEGYKSIEVDKI